MVHWPTSPPIISYYGSKKRQALEFAVTGESQQMKPELLVFPIHRT
jgi:hypothetical protein